jgi:hypothetical protein
MNPTRRRLGHEQERVLGLIAGQTAEQVMAHQGLALSSMLALAGRARSFPYARGASIEAAVGRHNAGTCGPECPVPLERLIVRTWESSQAGFWAGSGNGFGYWLGPVRSPAEG